MQDLISKHERDEDMTYVREFNVESIVQNRLQVKYLKHQVCYMMIAATLFNALKKKE